MQTPAELVPNSGASRMRPDASGCVGILNSSKFTDVSHREGRAQNLPLSPLPSPLPLGAGESASMSSGSNPLQSEDNSIIHPNFAAVQNVAKPVAQLDAHSVSSTSK